MLSGAIMSQQAFTDALSLVHDALLLRKSSGGGELRAGVPLASLQHLQTLCAPAIGTARPGRSRVERPQARPSPVSEPPKAQAAPIPTPAPTTRTSLAASVRSHLPPPAPAPAPVAPAGGAEEAGAKADRMAALRQQADDQLALSSTPLVFGTGSLEAEIMFIGDTPTAEDEAHREPFRDAPGDMLTKIIAAMGMRRENVYLANLLQTRFDLAPGQPIPPEELALHLPYLLGQIEVVRPRCLITLGGTTAEALLRSGTRIDRLRGNWQRFRNIPLMPTFHVAYLYSTKSNRNKRLVWEDLLQVLEHLGHPISAQQQSYFLPSRRA